MSYLSNPTVYVREHVKDLIKDHVDEAMTVYPEWHQDTGHAIPCIIMQRVGGHTEEVGMGDRINATTKAWDVFTTYQLDIWHNDATKADVEADKVLYAILDHRDEFRATHNIEVLHATRLQDVPLDEPGVRGFRRVVEARFRVRATAPISS